MGSFDIVSRYRFKTAPDGRQVFFPWSIFGRGYTFGSADDYRRLRRQVNAFILVEMVAIILAGVVRFSAASLGSGLLLANCILRGSFCFLSSYIFYGCDPCWAGCSRPTSDCHCVVLWPLEGRRLFSRHSGICTGRFLIANASILLILVMF